MLSAEAVRLLAVETLLPTASLPDGPFPTMARGRVLDSRPAAIADLDRAAPYTPVVSLYTPESGARLRGPHAPAGDTEADCILDVVCELAVVASDPQSGAPDYVAAMAETDPTARLVLAALAAQVRHLLERSAAGGPWRRIVRQVREIEIKTYGVPEYGLRWHGMVLRFHLSIPDDDFDLAGGLPQPLRQIAEALPAGSYAKAKLAELADAFAAEAPAALTEMRGVTAAEGIVFGVTD
ncbi:hypothetical protein BJF92_12175 [Rhizobium rhizosphaerae]|uniref:Uncharacterized protein n=1 Tax=Xaviernesmea rhizosphaerae TaxID=1672749 RepID=A0A1Q9AN84_9HYPH|nr:hypothetical protein [Xaviernesmea rhizosphaerae]OLP56821.1 hypothetical protein BJF92_12175 [Xaviernesmea rhizosphaerae]